MALTLRYDAYRRWNAAFLAEYFRREAAGRPVYLAVDDDELRELAPAIGVDPNEAASSLAAAVALEARKGGDLFRSFLRDSTTWRKEVEEPPYLALLGLCVLAASRMARDPDRGTWSNDYYSQLNPLLGRRRDEGRPPNFDELKRLWLDLARWLDGDLAGARGKSTIRTHSFFVHVGYPISQCLLRAADRRRLPDFFRSVGLEPGAEISGERLLVLFRAWARPGALTAQGHRVVASTTGGVEDTLIEILQRELADWDGELRDERGRRRAEILLFAESLAGGRRIELRLYARRPDGFPEGSWELGGGRRVELRAVADGWYGRLPVEVSRNVLREGLTLTNGGFALALDPDPAIPFRAAFLPDAGWLMVRQATALEEHIVLAHTSVESELRAFLGQNAERGWRIQRRAGDVPRDWLVADRVRIAAVPPSVPDSLRRLAPRLNTAMRLEGGLPLGRQLYLTGGEPDLWITVEDDAGVELAIDDTAERLGKGIVKFALRDLDLQPGPHAVTAAGETRRFRSEATYGVVVPDGAGKLGHVLERHGTYMPQDSIATAVQPGQVPRGQVVVCGAHVAGASSDLPSDPFPPVVVRCGFSRYAVVGALPGQLARPNAPTRPRWLSAIDPPPTYQFFEFTTPFRAQLVLYSGISGVRVRLAHESAMEPMLRVGIDDGSTEEWAQEILDAERREPDVPTRLKETWAAYVVAAQEIVAARR